MSLRLLSKPIAAFSAVALGLGMLVGASGFTASHAADNTDITILNPKIQASDRDLNVDPTDPALKVGNVARLSFDWDASNADPRSGQSFTVGFGDNFLGAPTSVSKIDTLDLTLPTGEVVGSCQLTRPNFVCSFNAKLDELRAKGGIEVKGTAKILVTAIRENDDSFVNMNLNGTQTRVALPRGEALVRPGMTPYRSIPLSKSLVPTVLDQPNLGYTISFTIEGLNAARVQRGLAPLAGDGVTPQTIVLEDTLGPGQVLGPNITLNRMVVGTRVDEPTGAILPSWVPFQLASILRGTVADGFAVSADPQAFRGQTAVNITLTGPFKTGVVYTVVPSVHANTSPKGVIYGYTYSNAVTERDTGMGARAERPLNAAAQVTITMRQGWATATLAKEVLGTGLGHITEPAAPYAFDVAFTLPGGGVASDFDQAYRARVQDDQASFEAGLVQEWPGVTFTPDKRGGTGPMNIIAGGTPVALAALPAGTSITITEKDRALTPGAQWLDPVFVVDGVSSAPSATKSHTLVLADQQVAKVREKNTVEKQKGRLSIRKTTGGDGGKGATHAYSFEYSCTDGTTGTAQGILGDGADHPVNGKNGQPLELPVGTKCTVAEDVTKAQIDGLSLENPPAIAKVVIQDGQAAVAEFDNVYVPGVTFSVTKKVVGTDSGDKKFNLSYVCSKDGKEIAGAFAAVTADGTVESGLVPAGSTCRVTEDVAAAAIPGFNHAFTAPNNGALEVTVGGANTIEVTNTYTPRYGSITITKQVNGLDGTAEADRSFEINVSCPSLPQPKVVNLKNGESATVNELLEGERCKIAEVNADVDKMNRDTVITPAFVTIKHNDGSDESIAQVTVTNTYSPKPGSLKVTKKLNVPDGTAFAQEKFPINVSCNSTPAITKTFTLGHDEHETITGIPAGTVCSVTETAPDKVGYDKQVVLPADVTIKADEESAAVVTNTYTEKPGSLVITKKLTDPNGAIAAGTTFPIAYDCGAGKADTVNLAADGTHTVANIPAGRTCTVTEVAPRVDGFTESVQIDGSPVQITRDATANVTVTNSYVRDLGSLVITKKVEVEDGAPFVGRSFDITYTCGDPANPVKAGTVSLANGESATIADIPSGVECSVDESTVGAYQKGYANVVSIDDPTVVMKKDTEATVTVTNRYTPLTGSFVIAKSLAGDGAGKAQGKNFTFTYECTDLYGASQGKKSVEIAAGENASIDARPGSCVISEEAAPIEHTQHGLAFAVNGVDRSAGPITIDIPEDGDPVGVNAVNTYTLDRGTFTIAKTATGVQDELKDKDFLFHYSCTGNVKGQVMVKADGVAVQAGDPMPVGTECTFTENVDSAQIPGFTLAAPDAQTATIGAADDVAALNFVNAYTQKPQDKPDDTKPGQPGTDQPQTGKDQSKDSTSGTGKDTPKAQAPTKKAYGKLASTGSTAMTVVGIAAVALILGGAITWIVRRRR